MFSLWKFKGCVESISRGFQETFKGVSGVFLRVFEASFKGVCFLLHVTYRIYPSRRRACFFNPGKQDVKIITNISSVYYCIAWLLVSSFALGLLLLQVKFFLFCSGRYQFSVLL